MSKICPCLWFDGEAEEAATLYVSLLPDSGIETIQRNSIDSPAGKAGSVLVVEFTLAGQRFMALNGGPVFKFTQAISLFVNCETQEEVDELWEKLSAGGEKSRCGWLKDKFGLSWQIVPAGLGDMLQDKNPEKAKNTMQAMLQMGKLDIAKLRDAHEQG